MTKNRYKKKLIEVAIPLEAINAASAREKSIRHGHPSTLHLWWARRPLAACRAVLFSQLVDDPSEYVDELLANKDTKAKAEKLKKEKLAARKRRAEEGAKLPADDQPVTVEECAIEVERQRLFKIIEELVVLENSTNAEVLERARAEIRRCCGDKLPPVYDPFSGGGSIPLEAQRLGLPAYGSDLNPVAVMIGKAMIEIPPKFKDWKPIHPGTKEKLSYRNAEGLAEDVKYYGEWMREQAWKRIGRFYPQVELPKEQGGGTATVIAWLWARTVASPDPSLSGKHVPLISSYVLSSRPGKEAIVLPEIDRTSGQYEFRIRNSNVGMQEVEAAKTGTRSGKGQDFVCLLSGTPVTRPYIQKEGKAGRLGARLMAIVAEGPHGRFYLEPNALSMSAARDAASMTEIGTARETLLGGATPTRAMITGGVCSAYGLSTWGSLFSDRQTLALNTFSRLIADVRAQIEQDALTQMKGGSNERLRDNGNGAKAYAEAVAIYLCFAVDKCADYWSSLCSWHSSGEKMRNTFGRQALPMVWDYAEANPFCASSGNWTAMCDWVWKTLAALQPNADGDIKQLDAQSASYAKDTVISTDPPYLNDRGHP